MFCLNVFYIKYKQIVVSMLPPFVFLVSLQHIGVGQDVYIFQMS